MYMYIYMCMNKHTYPHTHKYKYTNICMYTHLPTHAQIYAWENTEEPRVRHTRH